MSNFVPTDVNIASQSNDMTIADGGNTITVDGGGTSNAVKIEGVGGGTVVPVSGTVGVQGAGSGTSASLAVAVTGLASGATVIPISGGVTVSSGSIAVSSGNITVAGTVAINDGNTLLPTAKGTSSDTLNGLVVLGYDGIHNQVVKTDSDGNLQVDILSSPTITIQDGGNTITVDGTVTSNQGSAPWTQRIVDGTASGALGIVTSGGGFPSSTIIGVPIITNGTTGGTPGTAKSLVSDDNGYLKTVVENSILLSTSGNTIKIDSSNNTIKIDSSNNTVKIDPSNNAVTFASGSVFQLVSNDISGYYLNFAKSGSSSIDTGIVVLGYDGTHNQIIKTDTSGNVQVDIVDLVIAQGGATNTKYGIGILGTDGSHNYMVTTDSSGDLQVDILGVTPGVSATSLGKAEDAGHSSGDVGVMALAVRQDSLSALADTTGDYIPLTTNAKGELRVSPNTIEYEHDFNTTGYDTTIDCQYAPMSIYSLQVTQKAATVVTWQVFLEGSLDGTNWTTLLTHASGAQSLGDVVFSDANRKLCRYLHINCKTLTGTGSPAVSTYIIATRF